MSKKFIFSAVALMAFSFAGMANEIEEKKVEVKVVTDCDSCQQWADSQDVGYDPKNTKWMQQVDYCYDNNNCDNLRFRDSKATQQL